MSPNFLTSEFILIAFFVLIGPWPDTRVTKTTCSRDDSRLVRKIVRSKWTPILDKYQVKLPLECPLHPFRDLYAPRQDAKKRDRPTQWTCRICGKSFYEEKFLDQHFDHRHKDVINKADDSVCLASLCDVFRCDVFQSEESSSLKTPEQNIITDVEVWGSHNAAYRGLVKLKTSALSARVNRPNRQLCPDQMAESNPKETDNAADSDQTNTINAKESFKTFKKTVGADSAHLPPLASAGSSILASTSVSKPASASAFSAGTPTTGSYSSKSGDNAGETDKSSSEDPNNCTNSEDSGEVNNPADRDDNGNNSANGSSIPQLRANCRPEELHYLKIKCERLVRDCTGALLLSMSDHAYKEMEIEMNKAVCWYLSCDRYWEDGPLEPRPFPWLLILVLLFALSTGICFCYYIIWVLFDSEDPQTNNGDIIYNNAYHMGHGSSLHQNQQQHQAYQQQQQYPSASQHYFYQQQQPPSQQQQLAGHPIYAAEQNQYEYNAHLGSAHRHSPRHHSAATAAELRQSRGPTNSLSSSAIASSVQVGGAAAGLVSKSGSQSTSATPLHHHRHQHHLQQQQQQLLQHHANSLAYQQDMLDRREYIGRPIATTVLGGHQEASASTGSVAGQAAVHDFERNARAVGGGAGSGGGGARHYNTHPRPLNTHHRYVGSSQQSLRGSSSSHEIIQNEVGQNEHYIYVTYPPDLKKRFFDKYE